MSYAKVLDGSVVPGRKVAVMGAGGIGVDVSHYLTHDLDESLEEWLAHWGVADPALHPGGLGEKKPRTPAREVYLLQRKTAEIGKGLGKTSGWAHRAVLRDSGVHMVPGVTYRRIDDQGLHITVGAGDQEPGERRLLDVDHVVVCTGQESERSLYDELVTAGVRAHLVGGADVAAELDAKRAIRQGTEVARAVKPPQTAVRVRLPGRSPTHTVEAVRRRRAASAVGGTGSGTTAIGGCRRVAAPEPGDGPIAVAARPAGPFHRVGARPSWSPRSR